MENEFSDFSLIYLKKKFNDLEIKFHGILFVSDDSFNVLHSQKTNQYYLVMNLEKFHKIKSFQTIFKEFRENYIKDEKMKEIIFCLITFKNKFIIYNYQESEKIYKINFDFFTKKTQINYFILRFI